MINCCCQATTSFDNPAQAILILQIIKFFFLVTLPWATLIASKMLIPFLDRIGQELVKVGTFVRSSP